MPRLDEYREFRNDKFKLGKTATDLDSGILYLSVQRIDCDKIDLNSTRDRDQRRLWIPRLQS